MTSDHQAHRSFVFLLDDDGQVLPLSHDEYVALAQGRAERRDLAGRRLRLADWYVRLGADGAPDQVVSEWYGWVEFDSHGRFDPAPGPIEHPVRGHVDESAVPSAAEYEALTRELRRSPA